MVKRERISVVDSEDSEDAGYFDGQLCEVEVPFGRPSRPLAPGYKVVDYTLTAIGSAIFTWLACGTAGQNMRGEGDDDRIGSSVYCFRMVVNASFAAYFPNTVPGAGMMRFEVIQDMQTHSATPATSADVYSYTVIYTNLIRPDQTSRFKRVLSKVWDINPCMGRGTVPLVNNWFRSCDAEIPLDDLVEYSPTDPGAQDLYGKLRGNSWLFFCGATGSTQNWDCYGVARIFYQDV